MYRPKVGEDCIITWVNGVENGIVTITYVGDGVACYKSKINNYSGELMEYTCALDSVTFRPLKSKRDEYCCEVYDILKNSQSIPECCERLYDAGYRKQMPYDDALDILIKVESLNLSFEEGLEKLGYTTEDN
jgi:hypothetical protein